MRFASFAQLARAFAILTACAFSGFMLIVAPIELWQVHVAHTWRAAPARLIGSGLDYPGMEPSNGPSVWYRLALRDGRTVEIRDVRPGDFPFRISVLNADLFDTASSDLTHIRAAHAWSVYESPSGGKAYIEPGDYTLMGLILTLSLSWWSWILLRRRTNI